MNTTVLKFAEFRENKEALGFLQEAQTLMGRSRDALHMAEHLLRRAKQVGGISPYAMSIEEGLSNYTISMLFSLPPAGSAVVKINPIGAITDFYIRALPYTRPSECVNYSLSENGTITPVGVKSPHDCTVLLPQQYLSMPLICKNGDVFAPWLVAHVEWREDEKGYMKLVSKIVDYIALAMEYDQLRTTFPCFAGTEAEVQGEWLVLGYAPLEEIGDNTSEAKIRILVSSELGWIHNGREVFGIPVDGTMFIYPTPVTENSVLVYALLQDLSIELVSYKGNLWTLASQYAIILRTDLTVGELLSCKENVGRMYNAIRVVKGLGDNE